MPINRPFADVSQIPSVIPIFPLSRAVLLPRGELPLNIFEPRYVAMIDDAMKNDRLIGMIQPSRLSSDNAAKPDLEAIGCIGRVTQLAETGDGRYILNLTGVVRFRIIEELDVLTPYRQCRVETIEFKIDLFHDQGEDSVDRASVINAFRDFAEGLNLQADWSGIQATPTEALINGLVMMAPFDHLQKQELLEARDIAARAAKLISITTRPASPMKSRPTTLH